MHLISMQLKHLLTGYSCRVSCAFHPGWYSCTGLESLLSLSALGCTTLTGSHD